MGAVDVLVHQAVPLPAHLCTCPQYTTQGGAGLSCDRAAIYIIAFFGRVYVHAVWSDLSQEQLVSAIGLLLNFQFDPHLLWFPCEVNTIDIYR